VTEIEELELHVGFAQLLTLYAELRCCAERLNRKVQSIDNLDFRVGYFLRAGLKDLRDHENYLNIAKSRIGEARDEALHIL
jgi:hypothetical protein